MRTNLIFKFLLLPAFFQFISNVGVAQNNCPSDAPSGYNVEQSGSNCYLVFVWPSGFMPELTCGTPGTPAAGSGAFQGKLIDMTLDATVVLYSNGNNCGGGVYNLVYHPTIPNAYISTTSQCVIAAQNTVEFVSNRTGGSNFSCTMANNNPLPVELVSFTSVQDKDQITLEWSTTTETNNSHFDVERSINGGNFERIGTVAGAGNTISEMNYSFVDPRPAAGLNYYRLKQVDFDGAFEYSSVIKVEVGSNSHLRFYPTKISSTGTLEYQTAVKTTVPVQIVDMYGRVVRSEPYSMEKGINRIELQLADLPAGMYFITVQEKNRSRTTVQVMKLKS